MILQAIVTKYHGPTEKRQGRIIATAAAGRITVEWDHAFSHEANHTMAACAFAEKMKWGGQVVRRRIA